MVVCKLVLQYSGLLYFLLFSSILDRGESFAFSISALCSESGFNFIYHITDAQHTVVTMETGLIVLQPIFLLKTKDYLDPIGLKQPLKFSTGCVRVTLTALQKLIFC